ncbi:MAG: OsmC family protein [Actinomycetaceae bacterium]|nr:OsmC family protein [Actinomycetaceae bacterium]MDY6082380.1 OsmC family protein [Actinomycetaceae bacterium]
MAKPRTYPHVELTRVDQQHYRASNGETTVDFGQGEGLFTPVQLLMAALAGCSAIDVDVATSRHAEPTEFSAAVDATYLHGEPDNHLEDVTLTFNVHFNTDDEEGRRAQNMVDKLVKLSHDRDCTVARTLMRETPVEVVVK